MITRSRPGGTKIRIPNFTLDVVEYFWDREECEKMFKLLKKFGVVDIEKIYITRRKITDDLNDIDREQKRDDLDDVSMIWEHYSESLEVPIYIEKWAIVKRKNLKKLK